MHSDKVAHFLAMVLLTSISAIAFPRLPTSAILLFMMVVAGAIELIQIAGPRSADWFDFISSCAGILAFATVYYMRILRDFLHR